MRQERRSQQAYSAIVELIRDKALSPGDRLPAESQLAAQIGVSRTIVREALARLASDGITDARRGSGSFVMNRPSDRLGSYVPPEDLHSTLGSYEVRFALETEAARLAALRRSSDDMARISAALADLRAALLSSEPAHVEDVELHRRIAEATGNPVFLVAFDVLWPEVERIMRAGVDISRSRPPEVIATMLREHEVIVDAIRNRDADGASLAMRWHLWEGRRRLMV